MKLIKEFECPDTGRWIKIVKDDNKYQFQEWERGVMGLKKLEEKNFKLKSKATKYFNKHKNCIKLLDVS